MIFYLSDTEETVFFSFEVMTSLSVFVMRVNHIITDSSATTSSIPIWRISTEVNLGLEPFRMFRAGPQPRECQTRLNPPWYVDVGVSPPPSLCGPQVTARSLIITVSERENPGLACYWLWWSVLEAGPCQARLAASDCTEYNRSSTSSRPVAPHVARERGEERLTGLGALAGPQLHWWHWCWQSRNFIRNLSGLLITLIYIYVPVTVTVTESEMTWYLIVQLRAPHQQPALTELAIIKPTRSVDILLCNELIDKVSYTELAAWPPAASPITRCSSRWSPR